MLHLHKIQQNPGIAGRKARRAFGAICLGLAVVAACAVKPVPEVAGPEWQVTDRGVIVHPETGEAKSVRVEFVTPAIVRVTSVPDDTIPELESLMVVAQSDAVAVTTEEHDGVLFATSPGARAEVSLDDGSVRIFGLDGKEAVSTLGAGSFATKDVQGETFYATTLSFNPGTDEGVYGLGAHQTGEFNYNGADIALAQHNIDDAVPFLVSTRNYGILWDNNGISRLGDPRPYQPLDESLIVRGAAGEAGGLTGSYYKDNDVLLVRAESDPDYQYLPADEFLTNPPGRNAWPAEFGTTDPTKIVWEGSLEAKTAGEHRFKLYASNYFKVWVDGELVLDRWRQNWNPWYHNFSVDMAPGEQHAIRIEWIPNGGYLRLLHQDPRQDSGKDALTLSSEVSHAIDYYVVVGNDMDDAISGYRKLTGAAVLLPKWAYGFWQSRQRYTTQEELVDVVKEYRDEGIPFDNVVLDWFYWPEDAWGSHTFDPARFPDPKGMVDEVHDLNAQVMISVWPKFYPTTDNYKELDAAGHIYQRQIEMKSKDWVGPGYENSFYDPYSQEARDIYWRQINENIASKGFDAWWMDATEPDSHSNIPIEERALRMGPTSMGPGEEFFNSFVLMNSRAIYEGEQASRPNKRSFLLTRSAWGGMQRYASTVWSGDVTARWEDLKLQVPAGINMAMSGIPNWTHDIGGFAVEDRYTKQDPAHLEEWRELYSRWFQFGAFTPLFRSHGEFPFRESWNISPEGTEVYDGLVYYHKLRYTLLPYIYSAAASTYFDDGTIMRGLVMDFPEDRNVWNIGDSYMFGPDLLVAPVTEFHARSRNVYLPAGQDRKSVV